MTNPVVERLRRHGVRPRRGLGQHFLVDPRVLERILQCIAPAPGAVILEYGAGVGVLTEQCLDAGARVVAVELDDTLAALLRSEIGTRPNFELLHMDLAALDVPALLQRLGTPKLKVAGNLPYQLTSTVLFGLLDLETHLEDAVFMVQREVGERVTGAAGGRDYGILSVVLQAFYDIQIVMRVRPGAFMPPPRVDSCVLRFAPRAAGPALPWSERAAFVRLVRSVFNERRKVLRNTLKKFYGLDAAAVAACSAQSGIDCGRRPESLQVEEFVRLLHALPASVPAAGV